MIANLPHAWRNVGKRQHRLMRFGNVAVRLYCLKRLSPRCLAMRRSRGSGTLESLVRSTRLRLAATRNSRHPGDEQSGNFGFPGIPGSDGLTGLVDQFDTIGLVTDGAGVVEH